MLRAPLHEVLVLREHGVDHLVEHVLGRLAQELRVRIQGLVGLLIEAGAMTHEALPACARFDHGHEALLAACMSVRRRDGSRTGSEQQAGSIRADIWSCGRPTFGVRRCGTVWAPSRGVSDPPGRGWDAEGAHRGGSLTP